MDMIGSLWKCIVTETVLVLVPVLAWKLRKIQPLFPWVWVERIRNRMWNYSNSSWDSSKMTKSLTVRLSPQVLLTYKSFLTNYHKLKVFLYIWKWRFQTNQGGVWCVLRAFFCHWFLGARSAAFWGQDSIHFFVWDSGSSSWKSLLLGTLFGTSTMSMEKHDGTQGCNINCAKFSKIRAQQQVLLLLVWGGKAKKIKK